MSLWPMDDTTGEWAYLLCDIISVFHSRTKQPVKDCKINPFFPFSLTRDADRLKRGFCEKLCHFLSHFCRYIQKQFTNQALCKKKKAISLFVLVSRVNETLR